MNNNEKFREWYKNLEVPGLAGIDQAISKGIKKAKKQKLRNNILRSAAAVVLITFVGFSVLVNTSYAFAQSIIKLPPLRAIAKLVALDPTLKAALDNDYIQLVGATQETKDGYLSIHYIVADAQQITVFVSEKDINFDQCLLYDNAANLEILCSSGMTRTAENETLKKPEMFAITYDIADGYTLSSDLRLDFILRGSSEKLSFPIKLDQKFRNNVRDYLLGKEVNIDGQKITFDKIRISPTKARVYIKPSNENSSYIKGLTLRLIDEKGKAWNTESNGLLGNFNADNTDLASIMLESSYFSRPKALWLEISGYEGVPKAQSSCTFDFKKRTFEGLPEFLELEKISTQNGKITFSLKAKLGKGDNFGQIFDSEYVDETGKKQDIQTVGKSVSSETSAEFTIEIGNRTSGKAIFTVSNNPKKEISPITIPIY